MRHSQAGCRALLAKWGVCAVGFPPERERGGVARSGTVRPRRSPEGVRRTAGSSGGVLGADGGAFGGLWPTATDGRPARVGESGPPPVAAGGASYFYRHQGKRQTPPI